MQFTFSSNPIIRFECWFENSIVEPLSRYYYSKKKTHYKCAVCGRIEAPYFTKEKYSSITEDMGWHKFNGRRWPRWVCHHCAEHGFVSASKYHNYGYTWDEWQDIVVENNARVLASIKKEDPEYYEYWFDGGRERELFG